MAPPTLTPWLSKTTWLSPVPAVTLSKVGVSDSSRVTVSPTLVAVRLLSVLVTFCRALSALASLSLLAASKATL